MQARTIYSIYKATNLINGKSYIGYTYRFKRRQWEHLNESKHNNPKYTFHKAIKKYGIENFKWNIIFQTPSEETILLAEQYYISIYNTFKNGYNSTIGGETPSALGYKHTSKTIKNMKESRKGSGNGFYGKKHSQETINKLKESSSNNKFYKDVSVTFPDGTELIINHLKTFCKENNLNYNSVTSARYHKRKHKGYFFENI